MELKVFLFLLLAAMVTCRSQPHRALRLRRSGMTEKEKRLPQEDCGKQRPGLVGPVIFGGTPAQLGEFPWMAAIGYRIQGRDPTDIKWFCGGSLITDRYVITAAHCLDKKELKGTKNGVDVQYELATVRIGELNLDPAVVDGASPRDYDVDSFVIHSNWTKYHQVNDIGLIKLKEKVVFSDLVKPICLPPTNLQSPMFSVGDNPLVAGWGMTENSTGSYKLLKVRVKIVNQGSCKSNLTEATKASWMTELKIDNSVLCAGTKGMDSCKGDSGGPLMYFYEPDDESMGRYVLIGTVAYGLGCGLDGYPGVYSRVPYHMPWILENLDI